VIEAVTNTVTATIPLGGAPVRVAVTPDGGKVYVTDFGSVFCDREIPTAVHCEPMHVSAGDGLLRAAPSIFAPPPFSCDSPVTQPTTPSWSLGSEPESICH
jgi:DNA-binding beta-propeller fold protein YncE